MPRFFISESVVSDKIILTDDENVTHIGKVLRMREGDEVCLCDGKKTDYNCVIESVSKKEIILKIVSVEENTNESLVNITLFQGMPKGSKMDMIIQKCTELGVLRIVPFISKRTVASQKGKAERFQKIALEAAKQSGRGVVPEVCETVDFESALEMLCENELPLLPYEACDGKTLKDALRGTAAKSVGIMIGPEGGFDEEEIDAAQRKGAVIVTLGKRILRTETAGMSVISSIIYETEL